MARRSLLLFVIASFSAVSGQPLTYGVKGLQVNLNTHITGQMDQILWKHNGNKVVEYNGNQEFVYSTYKGRVTLDWFSAELKINDLTYEDSGEYVLEGFLNNNLQTLSYKLEVIDKVAKPTISCEMKNSSSSNTDGNQAMLNCYVESRQPPSLITIEWISDGKIQPGPKLAITLGGVHDNEEYRCRVRNPLTNETATFTAKDCYTDKPTSVALIASLSVLCGILVVFGIVFGIVYCKRRHAEGNNDLEKHLPPTTYGTNKETVKNEEFNPLLHRTATVPSGQQLVVVRQIMNPDDSDRDSYPEDDTNGMPRKGTVRKRIGQLDPNSSVQLLPTDSPTGLERNTGKETVSPPPPPPLGRKPTFCQDSNNDEGDSDAEELKEPDPSDSETTTEPDPVGVSDPSEDISAGLQTSPAPQQPEPEKTGDEDEEAKSHSANSISPPVAKPRSRLSQIRKSSQIEETTDEHKKVAEADQVTGETFKENVRPCDSLGLANISGPDDNAVPHQKGEETTAHEEDSDGPQEETHATENNHKERDKPVSENMNESDHDPEEIDKGKNLPLDTPQQPESPPKPDNMNTDAFLESPNGAHADPEKECKTRHDSHKGQSDNDTTEADKGEGEGEGEGETVENEGQCSPAEEQQHRQQE